MYTANDRLGEAMIKRKTKHNKGSSIILVIVMGLMLFIVSASMLTAGLAAFRSQIKHERNQTSYYYAKSVAQYLTSQITKTGTSWNSIPQSIYRASLTGKTVDVDNEKITLTPNTQWFASGSIVPKIEIKLNSQNSYIYQHYIPGVPDESIPAIPEEAFVTADMTVTITVPYEKSEYTIRAHYTFSGTTYGMGDGAGSIVASISKWKSKGYTHS